MSRHLVAVNYTDQNSDAQSDGVVPLESYPFLHVEPSGDEWVIQGTTTPDVEGTANTTTFASTYATRADAVAALNALAQGSGEVLYGTLS